jgi:hypothetical protein
MADGYKALLGAESFRRGVDLYFDQAPLAPRPVTLARVVPSCRVTKLPSCSGRNQLWNLT